MRIEELNDSASMESPEVGDNASVPIVQRFAEEINSLLPSVLWAQREEYLTLKVEVSEATDPKIDLAKSSITFSVTGSGAQRLNRYRFSLDFYKPINTEGCFYAITPTCVNIQLRKERVEWWPRLIPSHSKKPHFLKYDFEKWMSESDCEELKQKTAMEEYEKRRRDEKLRAAWSMENLTAKEVYLLMYNGAQLNFFFWILVVCTHGRSAYGAEYVKHAYATCHAYVVLAVALSYLEVVHAYFGLVRTKWTLPMFQVSGRAFALFCLWLAEAKIGKTSAVWSLYMVWSVSEVIRYPFYMLELLRTKMSLVVWLRYHAWILLYPLGTFFELMIILKAAEHFNEQRLYTVHILHLIPFSFSVFLMFYCVLLMTAVSILMRHMWKMRQRRYSSRRKLVKSD